MAVQVKSHRCLRHHGAIDFSSQSHSCESTSQQVADCGRSPSTILFSVVRFFTVLLMIVGQSGVSVYALPATRASVSHSPPSPTIESSSLPSSHIQSSSIVDSNSPQSASTTHLQSTPFDPPVSPSFVNFFSMTSDNLKQSQEQQSDSSSLVSSSFENVNANNSVLMRTSSSDFNFTGEQHDFNMTTIPAEILEHLRNLTVVMPGLNGTHNETVNATDILLRQIESSHQRMMAMAEIHKTRTLASKVVLRDANAASSSFAECPVGNFCDGTLGVGPQACPMGRWNNLTAQTACALCPIGFECPFRAMLQPRPCSAGYVCANLSTEAATIQCPAGYYCTGGIATFDPKDTSYPPNQRPRPCPAGTYCLPGVVDNVMNDDAQGHPHSCNEGYWCGEASPTPSGSGRCNPGFYCPKGSSLPVPTDPGFYTGQPGSMVPIMCPPGYYAALKQLSKCTDCPAGFKCPNFGMSKPIVCQRGFYRSNNDSITCRACPAGSWSPARALPDKNLCLPCPPGRVCAINAMTQLDLSTPCLGGYFCPPGTGPSTQFLNKCPQGYVCDQAIGADKIYDLLCPAGYICDLGTPLALAKRSSCPPDYYCPLGTYTLGRMPVDFAIQRFGNGTGIDQKLQYIVTCPPIPTAAKSNSAEPCGYWIITYFLPNGLTDFHLPNLCLRGTTTTSKSTSLNDCFPKPGLSGLYEPITSYSPVDPNSADPEFIGYEESPFGLNRTGLFSMMPFLRHTFQCDWSGIDTSAWTYGLPSDTLPGTFRLNFFSDASLNSSTGTSVYDDKRIPTNFADSAVDKANPWSIWVFPLINMKLNLMFEIMHGTRLIRANEFIDTCNITVIYPNRANFGTLDMFIAIVDTNEGSPIDIPLNLPKLKLTQQTYLTTFGPSNVSVVLVNEAFESLYISLNERVDYGGGFYTLPYLPFFSNCRGYGSYIPIYDIWENPKYCRLVDPKDTVVVTQADFFKSAISDNCDAEATCQYEESVNAPAASGEYWFAINGKQNMFRLSTYPVSYDDVINQPDVESFQDGIDAIVENFDTSFTSDDSVPVVGQRDFSNIEGLPRTVQFDVYYHQLTPKLKKIIYSEILLTDFTPDRTDLKYTLKWKLVSMPWIDLFNRFAFAPQMYTFAFIIVAAAQLGIFVFVYLLFRSCARHSFTNFHFVEIQKMTTPGPIFAILVVVIPIIVLLLIIYELMVTRMMADNVSCNFSSFYCDQGAGRAMRISQIFMSIGAFLIFTGAHLAIPTRVSIKKARKDLKKDLSEDDPLLAFKNQARITAEMVSDEGDFTPRYWKRVSYVFFCMIFSIFMIFPIEFAYSQYFGRNLVTFVVIGKVLQPLVEKMCLAVLGEHLLMAPCITVMAWQQTLMTMGADTFIMHISCHFVLVGLGILQHLFYGPYISANMEGWGRQINHFLVKIGARNEDEDALEARQLAEAQKAKDPNTIARTSADLMEPLFEAITVMSAETVGHFLMPISYWILEQFVQETKITRSYDVADHHLNYYLIFAALMLAVSRITDAIELNLMENAFGWKVYDFMCYMKFRFENRYQKWKADELNPDSNLPPSMHSLDKMCFSSQYYIILTLCAFGMMMFTIGFETMMQNQALAAAPIMADALAPVLLIFTFLVCYYGRLLVTNIGHWLKIYKMPERVSAARDARSKVKIPNWMRLAELQTRFGGAEVLSEVETARLTNDAFRHQFLQVPENREFLMDRLKQLLTPRMASGMGTSFVTKLSQLVRRFDKKQDPNAPASTTGRDSASARGYLDSGSGRYDSDLETGRVQHRSRKDVSSDSEDDQKQLVVVRDVNGNPVSIPQGKFREVDLDAGAHYALRVWLHLARRRKTLIQWADEFTKHECGDECAECFELLRDPTSKMPCYRVPLKELVDIHEKGDSGHALTTQLDRDLWLQFLQERPISYVLCRQCYAKQRTSSHKFNVLGKHKAMKEMADKDKEFIFLWLSWARESLFQRQGVSQQTGVSMLRTGTLRTPAAPITAAVATPAGGAATPLMKSAQEHLQQRRQEMAARQLVGKKGGQTPLPAGGPAGAKKSGKPAPQSVGKPLPHHRTPAPLVPISDDSSTMGDDEDIDSTDLEDPDWEDLVEEPSSARSNPNNRPRRRSFVRPSGVSALKLPKEQFKSRSAMAAQVASTNPLMAQSMAKSKSQSGLMVQESFPAPQPASGAAAANATGKLSTGAGVFNLPPVIGTGQDDELAKKMRERMEGKKPENQVEARRMLNEMAANREAAAKLKQHVKEVNKDPITRVKQKSRALVALETSVQQMTRTSTSAGAKTVHDFVSEIAATLMSTARDDYTLTLSGRERPVGFLVPEKVRVMLGHWLLMARKRAAEEEAQRKIDEELLAEQERQAEAERQRIRELKRQRRRERLAAEAAERAAAAAAAGIELDANGNPVGLAFGSDEEALSPGDVDSGGGSGNESAPPAQPIDEKQDMV